LHVAHAGAEAWAVAARAGRLAEAAGVPGEDVEARQVQFVGQVRHAPGVLVAAVEQHQGAARLAAVGRRPVAVEEFQAVVAGKGAFLVIAHREIPVSMKTQFPAATSASPWRTRLTKVSSSSAASSASTPLIQAAGSRPAATPAPSAPKQ